MPRDFSDMDFDRLADKVAERVWASNVDSISMATVTVGTSSGDAVLGDPNMFRVHDVVHPEPEWSYQQVTTDKPSILALQEKIERLEETLKMVGQLLDEHIRRSNPVPTDRKRRSVILDQEGE